LTQFNPGPACQMSRRSSVLKRQPEFDNLMLKTCEVDQY
jgi:hypothetical protein